MAELAALGAAASVLQVIDFGTRFFATAWKISQSEKLHHKSGPRPDDFVISLEQLEESSANLRDAQRELQTVYTCPGAVDASIRSLAQKSESISKEILDSLDRIKKDGKGRKRDALRKTWLILWKEDKLKSLESRLNEAKTDLTFYLSINLRSIVRKTLEAQEHMLLEMREMRVDLKQLGASGFNTVRMGVGSLALEYLTSGLHHHEIKSEFLRALIAIIQNTEAYRAPQDISSIQLSQPRRQHLETIFISRIRYDTIQERELTIKDAYQGTFRWIFDDDDITGFKKWLTSTGKLYWITGKPGSGKSTLMRYLMQSTSLPSRQSKCEEHLRQWAGNGENLTIISFHFWAIGSQMQKTKEGLFRTLLVQLFQAHPEVIPTVAPSRWESLSLFNEGPQHLTETELGDMFRQAITHISTRAKLALFIDGLDEFDGDCNALVSLIGECTSCSIKICVSSRPWTEFENAFGEYPQLRMEDLTYNDMTRYVMAKFGANPRFRTFQERHPELATDISRSVTEKANGVFLWVNIVVSSLLAGIVSGDRIEDLESRLDLLPPEIQDLYEKIIESINPIYREHAAQLFKLKSACTETPYLQLLWYADEVKFLERAIDEVSGTVTVKEMQGRLEDMRLRIISRCKGLLEVHKHAPPRLCRSKDNKSTDGVAAYTGGTVMYLHRTFSDFLDRHDVQEKLDGFIVKTYDPNLRISAAYVALTKLWLQSMAVNTYNDRCSVQLRIEQSLRHAADAKESSASETVQLLDHLRDKCVKSCIPSHQLFGHYHANLKQAFLCKATVLGAGQYIKARANEAVTTVELVADVLENKTSLEVDYNLPPPFRASDWSQQPICH
ncbi:hypothetical protein FAVG1_07954 [Fusarium avenaceum]|nr:hypothetical protein FAVG1_07954 [Fusarium avenaceum]